MPEQLLSPEEITRAVQLMRNAGWVNSADIGQDFSGLKLTKDGQPEALLLHQIYRKLQCRSARDIYSVLIVLHWYLFKEDSL